jgi:membrane-bound lytic murein transglycosylase D
MKRKLAAAILCLSVLGTPAVASTVAGSLDSATEPVQTASLATGGLSASEREVNLRVVKYTRAEGSPFTAVMASIAPSVMTEATQYAYSASRPEEDLLACAASFDAASIDQALPVLTIADSAIDNLAPEADTGLPDVPIILNKNVESFIRYFQTNGRKHFEKWLGRSKDYMAMLQSILKENGLPEELSYIAFIESGLNPTVRSHANAVGMWQFIKGTATRYGLRVDWWIDERMDPEKATYAAAKYFKNLYGMFDSWYLAAASYNAGEGRVGRAIKRHGTEDFWELAALKKRSLHRETREYVPKYLAAVTIARDPESYGFEAVEFDEGIKYDKVRVSQATDLRVIADAAGTTVEEIRRLNPELLRWFTPPNYPGYHVKIPAGSTGMYAENMSKVPAAKRIAFLQHKVKRGETVSRIAKRYGTGVKPIQYLNNISGSRLKPGSIIMIPVRANDAVAKRKGKAVAEIVTNMELHQHI